jgi:hypothetical protein
MGALLSGARRIAFRHNDWQMVDDLLQRHRRHYERVESALALDKNRLIPKEEDAPLKSSFSHAAMPVRENTYPGTVTSRCCGPRESRSDTASSTVRHVSGFSRFRSETLFG